MLSYYKIINRTFGGMVMLRIRRKITSIYILSFTCLYCAILNRHLGLMTRQSAEAQTRRSNNFHVTIWNSTSEVNQYAFTSARGSCEPKTLQLDGKITAEGRQFREVSANFEEQLKKKLAGWVEGKDTKEVLT